MATNAPVSRELKSLQDELARAKKAGRASAGRSTPPPGRACKLTGDNPCRRTNPDCRAICTNSPTRSPGCLARPRRASRSIRPRALPAHSCREYARLLMSPGGQGHAGGEGGIRTPDRLAPMPHFECGAFNHSATSPGANQGRAPGSGVVLGHDAGGDKAGVAIFPIEMRRRGRRLPDKRRSSVRDGQWGARPQGGTAVR
jgi:hypothetical protein